MSGIRLKVRLALSVTIGGLALIAIPASAQEAGGDLDALIDGSASPTRALALARTQEAQGDLLGAAATLERGLLNGSGADSVPVRTHYVALLCRLGDRSRANVELGKLGGAPVADGDWAEVEQACGSVARPAGGASGANFVGQVTAGVAYDSDALGALTQQFVFPGFTTVRDDGFAFIGSVDLAGRIPVGSNFVYGQVSAVTKDNLSGPSLDYQIGDLHLGYGFNAGAVKLSGGFFGRYGRIAGLDFVGEYGGEARIALPTSATSAVALNGVVVHQNYAGSFPGFSRNGTRVDVALDWQGRSRDGVRYAIGAAFEDKGADTRALGYTGGRVFGALRMPFGDKGMYGALSATVRHVVYRLPVFGARQIETRYFARAALGTRLTDTLDIEAAGSYTRRDYNAASALATYDSVGAELRLVWNFGQGGSE